MNTKRIIFWTGFFVVIALIIWGLIVAMNKPPKSPEPKLGIPAPISATDHVNGPENALVTIIEYSDFQCPACQTYHSVIEQVLASSTVPIRLVYRHFPLNDLLPDGTIQHPNALLASQASEAAALQGKFWDMYHLLFLNHTDWTELPDPHAVFIGYAEKIGLDINKFKTDLDSQTTKEVVLAQKAEGVKLGINSTPTFFVNGKATNIPPDYDSFKTIIETAASSGAK